ncbi:uncharacterized protein LOC128391900 isoform X1 [Panonychus citri]|uniref:uncharacterized protein LOC128391900 isoform X1 n=1 Tax=Panonychus citri TaxID=50023 RepID=UPI00230782F1|nr:uncharacterized protein LOC128391900 isoform X1 [Panonychus citri]
MICNICYWTWSRFFLISVTFVSIGLVTFQYVEYNNSLDPLPLIGLVINCSFLIVITIGVVLLIKLFVGLLVVYALALVILIISAQSSPGLINFHVSTSELDSVDNQLTISVKGLLLLGLSWFLVGGQIIGSMLYLSEISGYLNSLDQFASNRFNNSDSYHDDHGSGENCLKLGWPSIAGLSTGSTYHEFGSTDSWNLPCSCHQNKSEASSSDTSKPFKWPISPNKQIQQSIQHQSQHDLHQLSITI